MTIARTGKNATKEGAGHPQADRRHPDRSPPAGQSAVPPDRVTVALIPKAVEDLKHLQDRTALSKTDITNRAIILYRFIDEQLHAGRDVLIRDKSTGETRAILILLRLRWLRSARSANSLSKARFSAGGTDKPPVLPVPAGSTGGHCLNGDQAP